MKKRESRTLFLTAVVIAMVFLAAGVTYAFNQLDLQKLEKTEQCQRCDLSGANLTGTYLHYANLSGANLTGATWVDGKRCQRDSIGFCIR